MLDAYAAAAEDLAEQEVNALATAPTPQAAVVRTVTFDVLGDRLLSCLRRLAQEDALVARAVTARAATASGGAGTAGGPVGVATAGGAGPAQGSGAARGSGLAQSAFEWPAGSTGPT